MELSVVAQQPAQSLLGTAAAPKPTPLTQTAAVGVIVPPPDIRSVVDKTAQFVARNGTEFEKRCGRWRENEAGGPHTLPAQHPCQRAQQCEV